MRGKQRVVRTFQIEELGEGELRRLIHWGQHYMEGGDRQFDDDADESDAILLEELRALLSGPTSKKRVASSESDADASESVSEHPIQNMGMNKGTVIDGGSGMIWRERD